MSRVDVGELDILPPYSSPQWCDHGPIVRTCSRCDPSEASGRLRAREARELARRSRGARVGNTVMEDRERLEE